jgi:hypothetical protein
MKIATVQDLIDALGEYPPDMPVKIAHQPSYPLRADVAEPVEVDGILYIPEGGNEDYASRAIFEGGY